MIKINAILICGFLWWLHGSALAFVKLASSNLTAKVLGTLPLLQKPRSLQSAPPLPL
jgi:hypothetical protein